MFHKFVPEKLGKHLMNIAPLRIVADGAEVPLEEWRQNAGVMECVSGNLRVELAIEPVSELKAVRWNVAVCNTGAIPMENIEITPLFLRLDIDPQQDSPRVRHLSGSYHYDGTYPPRAFRLSEERIMTHDHCKCVSIASGAASAFDHVPVMQFLMGPYGDMYGLFVGFEWSSRWEIQAGWESDSFFGQPRPGFIIKGNIGLGALRLEPGERLELPRIHMGFYEGADIGGIDNALRRYVREGIACKLQGQIPTPPVYYDHWFGLHQHFDVVELKKQAEVAAELGCEYFVLDAAWYKMYDCFIDGIGNWFEPDPDKFPNGVEELSEHVRALGMKFGIWHMIETAYPGTQAILRHPELYDTASSPMSQDPLPESATSLRRLRLDKPEAREFALTLLRKWITNWKVNFIRWECSDPQEWALNHDPSGKLNLAYMKGFYQVIDTIRSEFPEVYNEDCEGGGTRLDWGMAARMHGNWLSDHTGHPDVSRFFQMGASRFWPAHFLTSAVRAHRGSGDSEATSHNMLSRMVGGFGFNGDIAQWSAEARARAKHHIEVYKGIRHLLAQPIFFPLPQPRSDRDWDIVIFGDETANEQLLYAFRLEGPESITLPASSSGWTKLLGGGNAQISSENGTMTVRVDKGSSAIWIRR